MLAVRKQLRTIVLSTVALVTVFIAIFFYFTHQVVSEKLTLSDKTFFEIKNGMSFHQFSKELVKKGVIKDRFWLRNYVRIYPSKASIKTGMYQFTPMQTVGDLLNIVNNGDEHQFFITFIEGTRLSDWLNTLISHPNIKQSLKNRDYATVAQALDIDEIHPEGLFFPDTYAFTNNTSDIAILRRAYNRMQASLEEVWRTREPDLPLNNAYEALILASIIEKESADKSEYRLISSVFVNRLNKNMRLQTDPTVIYGVGERYDGDIKRSHLRDKNAYNTYFIKGLPPTPIAMPGLEAMKAAVAPEISEYFYFVSDGNGRHVFNTNLKAHNESLKQYLLKTN